MTVLILTSSPEKTGNSTTMANEFEEVARLRGAQVIRFDLAELAGEGCRSCHACKTVADRCVIDDPLKPALLALETADVVVLAAPVWFLDFPSHLRRFVERWHSLITPAFEPRLAPGKKAVILLSQGADAESYRDIVTRYTEMFGWLGIIDVHAVRHCDAESASVQERPEILDAVRDTAVDTIDPSSGTPDTPLS